MKPIYFLVDAEDNLIAVNEDYEKVIQAFFEVTRHDNENGIEKEYLIECRYIKENMND